MPPPVARGEPEEGGPAEDDRRRKGGQPAERERAPGAAGERHQGAVAEEDDAGPGGGGGAGLEPGAAGRPQGVGQAEALAQVALEDVEECRRLVVAQRPQAPDHGVGAGHEEAPGQAHDPLAPEDRAGGAPARREDHDPAVEIQVDDLADLKQAVLVVGARRQDDGRAIRMLVVGEGVSSQVEDPGASKVGLLQGSLAGLGPLEDTRTREPAAERPGFLPSVGQAPEVGNLSQPRRAFR